MKWNRTDTKFAAILALLILLLAWTAMVAIRKERAEAYCLSHGYSSAKITVTASYCIRRINNTDEVVRIYWSEE